MSEHQLPTVTVVMPVRDEAAYIERSLGAVLAQDYPADRMEVVVVDGLSTDGTPQLARAVVHRRPEIAVRVVENPGRIAPTALNIGIREARGEVVVRVDGHCEVAPDYVRACVDTLRRTAAGGVGGPLETIGETPTARAIAAAMSSSFGVGGSAFRTGTDEERPVDTVAFPAYRREVLDVAGPFDEELVRNQDDEYNYRLRRLGYKVVISPAIRACYYSRGTLRSLWRQYLQYGFWKVRVMQKHPRQMQMRQFVPAAFVGALVVLGLLGLVWPASWAALAIVASAYAMATLAAAVKVAAARGWRMLPLLPAVFAILHVAYGLGFLGGLARFGWRPAAWRAPAAPAAPAAHGEQPQAAERRCDMR